MELHVLYVNSKHVSTDKSIYKSCMYRTMSMHLTVHVWLVTLARGVTLISMSVHKLHVFMDNAMLVHIIQCVIIVSNTAFMYAGPHQ